MFTFACGAQLRPLWDLLSGLNGGLTESESELERTLVLLRVLVKRLRKKGRPRINVSAGRVFPNMREGPGPEASRTWLMKFKEEGE